MMQTGLTGRGRAGLRGILRFRSIILQGSIVLLLLASMPATNVARAQESGTPSSPSVVSEEDVSSTMTITNIEEKAVRKKRARRVMYRVDAEMTVTNTSTDVAVSRLRAVVNVIGTSCADKIWTRAFSHVIGCDLAQQQVEAGIQGPLRPGQSITFPVRFEKSANVQVSYEVVFYGVPEKE